MFESHDEVIETENCFIFDIKEAKKYLSEKQGNYSLTIAKVGEAKIEDGDDLNTFFTPKKSLTEPLFPSF